MSHAAFGIEFAIQLPSFSGLRGNDDDDGDGIIKLVPPSAPIMADRICDPANIYGGGRDVVVVFFEGEERRDCAVIYRFSCQI